jgi:hypothetical protein
LKILKYTLGLIEQQNVIMPRQAQVLTAQLQNGKIQVWAMVDTAKAATPRKFWILGTGQPVPDDCIGLPWVATVQMGDYVWHVFLESL